MVFFSAGMEYGGGMNNMRGMITQAPMPVNPDVKLKRLPFYDVLGELMKPSTLSKQLVFSSCIPKLFIILCYPL